MGLIDELAGVLGVHPNSVRRFLADGLTPPQPGETNEDWGRRAQTWRARTKRKPGPAAAARKLSPWESRYRKARAQAQELEVAKLAGRVHDVDQCERHQVQRFLELRNRLTMLPAKLMLQLVGVTDPEIVRRILEAELRHALADLGRRDRGSSAEAGRDRDDEESPPRPT